MSNNSLSFKTFAVIEMRNNGDKVRVWANQTNNPLLAALAKEVITAAGGAGK